ncbi:hypothetical protein [Microvirga sp. M2]|uniref:hypothetical protein n=1 Tax=Microvirga sp. M2 TaxID=3073270 RepID=UPI0039C0B0F2
MSRRIALLSSVSLVVFALISPVAFSTQAQAECSITRGGGTVANPDPGATITCTTPTDSVGIGPSSANNVTVDVRSGAVISVDSAAASGLGIGLGDAAQISIAGDIIASGKTGATGISAGNDLSLFVLSGAAVSVNTNASSSATAVVAADRANITVAGNLNASGTGSTGIQAGDDLSLSVLSRASVNATGLFGASAVTAADRANITLTGDLIASGKSSTGILAGNDLSLLVLSGAKISAESTSYASEEDRGIRPRASMGSWLTLVQV